MNKKMKIFIVCAVFTLISSCKNFAADKDIKQNVKEQVQGFLDKILDPKDKITSSGPKVDELARKLQEEELMQGDDPNGRVLGPPPVLPASGHDSTPILKAKEQSDSQQEGKVEKAETEVKEEKAKETEKEKKEQAKVEKEVQVEQVEVEKEDKAKKEGEEQKGEKKQEEARAEEAKQKAEQQKQEAEQQKQEAEKRKVETEIKTLSAKIEEISENINVIERQISVGAQGVIDRITGPIYDDFTDDEDSAIYRTWDLEESSELKKLLKELSDTRSELRTKLNEGNQKYTGGEEPKLKDSVSVSEIKKDLEKLKSKLEEVKSYLEDSSKFEEIKGYTTTDISYNGCVLRSLK
ncbi:ErpC protein (plasmid) [Borreliella californiensis]|uniref:DNA repair exonuclease SbcCD ATPase subunit n=1 Tax=Borreliella californiensis TaxID=373543 RepID=A0A7X0DS04_9SPIR|nr:ErpC protein [Borreliella californiensis]MBB6213872.1 DNA repair exonuclease SbcCD ATPase subunit [Borreliella californiensis]